MSLRDLTVANRSCTTEWWKAIALFSSSGLLSFLGLVANRCSAEGDVALPVISSGKSSITYFR
jgi:hypothetical protein